MFQELTMKNNNKFNRSTNAIILKKKSRLVTHNLEFLLTYFIETSCFIWILLF